MFHSSQPVRRLYTPFCALVAALAVLGAPAAAAAAPPATAISNFPSVHQWYNLSCEYAAAAAVTLYWGNLVSQRTFLQEVPADSNPHEGFRGDINGPFGGIADYGVYAEPLVPVLERHGFQAQVYYGDLTRLQANLRSGNPVVVWVTSGSQPHPIYTAGSGGETYRLVPGEHAVVAYGFDANGINLMDVGDGGYYHTSWGSFLRRWSYFDDMTLVITPQTAGE